MRLPIYLDYMATTPVDLRVANKMQHYLTIDGVFGNASSRHFYGSQAYEAIENARKQVAALVNTAPKSIFFTSGATEANNIAIKGAAQFYKRQGNHIITAKTEHKAVLDTCKFLETQGFEVTYLTPETDGLIDINKLENAIRTDTILVSIMHVNNEIGVIQNITEIGKIAHARGILFHVDAAQSAGKIPINLSELKVDLMSFAAHKIYGPKGIGALYIRQQPRIHLEQQLHGGDQEYGVRPGTLATHQIVGMGESFFIANNEMETESERILQLRTKFLNGLQNISGISINGSIEKRVAGNLNLSFAGIDNEIFLTALKDLAVSTAAACKRSTFEPSYVLRAIGLSNKLALNSIRFSLGRFTTEDEIAYAIEHIANVVKKLRD